MTRTDKNLENYEPALSARSVSARYPRSRSRDPIFQASLDVRPGELVAILGPNGAGKSTLLRVLSGQLAPYEGDVTLLGQPMTRLDRRAVARQLAVVTQSEAVAFGFTVREVVMMGRAPHQGRMLNEGTGDRDVVGKVLARFDLEGLADRAVSELSGGEQKRVAIARALAQEPRVLLLDEPAAFLDVRHQIDLYASLVDEIARAKMACVVVMHDLNTAAQYASRVVLVKGGRIVAEGPIAEVMTWARLRETFEADLYVGVNEITGDRFFLPMRER